VRLVAGIQEKKREAREMAMIAAAGVAALGGAAYTGYEMYRKNPDILLVTAMGGFSEGDMREAYERARRKELEEAERKKREEEARKEQENIDRAIELSIEEANLKRFEELTMNIVFNRSKEEENERRRIKARQAAIKFNHARVMQWRKEKTLNHIRRMHEREDAIQNHAHMMRAIEDARIAAQEDLKEQMTKLVKQKKSLQKKAKMVGRPLKSSKKLYRKHRSVLRQIEQVQESMESIL